MSAAQTFSEVSRKLGIVSALGVALLCPVYAVALVGGLLSLRAPLDPIGDPYFSILEILIMLLAPMMVVLSAVIHAWAPEKVKVFGLISLVFMSLLAVVTCGVHFVILTVSRDASVATLTWAPLFLSFKWPSVVYALDILAWDILFALSTFFAACVFDGSRLAKWIRGLLTSSGALAFLGLAGVAFGDMQLRNIGILGYVGVFPIAALLLAILFIQAKPSESEQNEMCRSRPSQSASEFRRLRSRGRIGRLVSLSGKIIHQQRHAAAECSVAPLNQNCTFSVIRDLQSLSVCLCKLRHAFAGRTRSA